jgi:uncharacterized protein
MITNKTTKKVISQKEKYCRNIFSQTLGLMFSRRKNLVMVFNKERTISLHNFFVFFPLDILVLDENKKVVEIKENFQPFTFWNAKKKGKYLVELADKRSKNKVKIGNIMNFVLNEW